MTRCKLLVFISLLACSSASYSQPCECIEACLKLIVDSRPQNQVEYEAMNFGFAKICYEKGGLTNEQYGAQLKQCPKFDLWMNERDKLDKFMIGNTEQSLGNMGYVLLKNEGERLDSVRYIVGDSLYTEYDRGELTKLFQNTFDNIKMKCANPKSFRIERILLTRELAGIEMTVQFYTDKPSDAAKLMDDPTYGYYATFVIEPVNLSFTKTTYPDEDY